MPRYTLWAATGMAALAVTAVTACGGDSGSTPGQEGTPVAVTVTRTECQVAATLLPEGSITFTITNRSGSGAEVAVYATGDRLVATQRDIGDGTVTDLVTVLKPGTYEIACRAGGAGVRQRITVR